MFTVTDLARQADVTPDTVRHYVLIGLLEPEVNPFNGYKIFDSKDIKKVQFVRQAKSLGFTLAEISEILTKSSDGISPSLQVREIIQHHIKENHSKLDNLNALQHRMEYALKKWEAMPDGMPDGLSVCRLIESVTEGESEFDL
jgi:MerR family Zn(II)-responsive transcriptional regulator of zntA